MTTIDDEFTGLLHSLLPSRRRGRKLQRDILDAGASSMADTVRKGVPGRHRRIRRATTHTVDERSGKTSARVGINIASKKGHAPHARWIIKGTKLRATKNGANRGRIRGDDFFSRSIRTGQTDSADAMQDALNQELKS